MLRPDKRWERGRGSVPAVPEDGLRLRFHLRNGKLYSFWVAADASGASRGYVAAGGPGFTDITDTVGKSRN